jgi:peptidoglycan L-alanyl-D-glutamate endopeptidase CwlK
MTYVFGKQSLARLEGVHPKMVAVVKHALEIMNDWDANGVPTTDIMVLEGVRAPERQKELFAQGRTKPGKIVTWTLKSNHFKNPKTGFGHAVDLVPYPVDWNDTKKFDRISRAMFQAASELDTPIRWGADWDRDGHPRERGESDSPHFELWGF